LRASRISLGKGKNFFINKYAEDFDDKTAFRIDAKMKDNNLRATNIVMGTSKNKWETQTALQHCAKKFNPFASDITKKQA